MSLIKKLWGAFNVTFESLAPITDVIVRVWLFSIFYFSGMLKYEAWPNTITLFKYKYNVPLLDPYWAAVLGTAAEIILPVLLLVGMFGRLPALGLFIFNLVAVYSYPLLWNDAGAVGFKDHIHWGLLLLFLLCHGTGKLSVDGLYLEWRGRR